MPELPEVQTTVDGINEVLKGLVIKSVWTNYKSDYHTGKDNIKNPKYFAEFQKQIVGRKIIKASRRAKNILIHLSNHGVILVHMKMTGHLLYGDYIYDAEDTKDPWHAVSPEALRDPFNRHVRMIFTLSNGRYLALSDVRKFAKVTFIEESELSKSLHLEDLGPEPLDKDFDLNKFKSCISKRPQGIIKKVLLDPKIISGIGNIYSDEILWESGVHPLRKVATITSLEWKRMFEATKTVLRKGIDFGGDSTSDYRNIFGERGKFSAEHHAYRKTGSVCAKRGCGGKIVRIALGGRGAHFCDTHQK